MLTVIIPGGQNTHTHSLLPASFGLRSAVILYPGIPFQPQQVQYALIGIERTPFVLTRLAMAIVNTRRIVAVPRATRNPGRVATRTDSAGSQCNILGPFWTHFCGRRRGVMAVGPGVPSSGQVRARAPACHSLSPHITLPSGALKSRRRGGEGREGR